MSNGYNVDMGEVLEATKAVLLASTAMPYLSSSASVRIINGQFYAEPWSDYTVYLRPLGSPEETVAWDGDRGYLKYAVHTIQVEAVKKIENPYDEDAIVGRIGASVGITKFVGDICELLENNLLALSSEQIDYGVPPTIEFPANAYGVLQAEDDIWLHSAAGIYRVRTRPFYRTGVFT